jgi:hypothetical protein
MALKLGKLDQFITEPDVTENIKFIVQTWHREGDDGVFPVRGRSAEVGEDLVADFVPHLLPHALRHITDLHGLVLFRHFGLLFGFGRRPGRNSFVLRLTDQTHCFHLAEIAFLDKDFEQIDGDILRHVRRSFFRSTPAREQLGKRRWVVGGVKIPGKGPGWWRSGRARRG